MTRHPDSIAKSLLCSESRCAYSAKCHVVAESDGWLCPGVKQVAAAISAAISLPNPVLVKDQGPVCLVVSRARHLC